MTKLNLSEKSKNYYEENDIYEIMSAKKQTMASEQQLNIAKEKVKDDNVEFICCSAENIPLEDNSIDSIISTWVLRTILEEDRRTKVFNEMRRVLKENGSIYLVENDIGGEFEEIRNRYPDISRTKKYNNSLENNGFKCYNKFETYFKFDSTEQAQKIFSNIWGTEIGKKVSKETKYSYLQDNEKIII